MLVNDNRTYHNGLVPGQTVRFRWCGLPHRGLVKRLASSKALIRFFAKKGEEVRWRYVAYNQIEESTKHDRRGEVPESITVWVVEAYMGIDVPSVHRYEAKEVRKDSFTVAQAGKGRPLVIRKAVGRHFFVDRDKMVEHCRCWMQRQLRHHEEAASKLRRDLDKEGLGIEVVPHGSAIKPREGA